MFCVLLSYKRLLKKYSIKKSKQMTDKNSMKTAIALLASFYFLYPLYGVSEVSSGLIGKWRFVDSKCEGNQGSKKLDEDEEFGASSQNLHFQTNGTAIDSVSLSMSLLGETITCQ